MSLKCNSVGDLKDQNVNVFDGGVAFTGTKAGLPQFCFLCRMQCRRSSEYKPNPCLRLLLTVEEISVKKCTWILNMWKHAPCHLH